ncbi:MAG: 3'-5' exonuclease [Sulfurospirillaceae bacterium]|nr:3'-5' exonuclease [Sulfurospirillaceae bacterium]
MICVFDIETIPDAEVIRDVFAYEGEDKEVSLLAMSEQEAKNGSSFLPLSFHKIVAISAVIADEFGIFRKVSSIEGKNEFEMIKNFLGFIDKKSPKLVSFNGRSFDMPLLMLRALRYNLTCSAYFESDNKENGKNKWENYRARYSDKFHIDLMDQLCEFGAVRGMKLDHVCSMAGLPGKYDVSGDQVMELFYAGEIEKIKEYCESDVLNTYWLFLKHELLKGNLIIEDYKRALATMQENLRAEKSYTDVFGIAIEEELYKEN